MTSESKQPIRISPERETRTLGFSPGRHEARAAFGGSRLRSASPFNRRGFDGARPGSSSGLPSRDWQNHNAASEIADSSPRRFPILSPSFMMVGSALSDPIGRNHFIQPSRAADSLFSRRAVGSRPTRLFQPGSPAPSKGPLSDYSSWLPGSLCLHLSRPGPVPASKSGGGAFSLGAS